MVCTALDMDPVQAVLLSIIVIYRYFDFDSAMDVKLHVSVSEKYTTVQSSELILSDYKKVIFY